jgi:hypothetical protein
MEVTKIKISPQVLKNDISQISYSGNTFGYYSGLTEYLSQTVVTNYRYKYGGLPLPGGFIFSYEGNSGFGTGFIGYLMIMSRFTIDFVDTLSFFQKLPIGQKVEMTRSDGTIIDFILYEKPTISSGNLLSLKLKTINTLTDFFSGEIVNLNFIQKLSLLTDLTIPLLLKQSHEDIGYYSPFDGNISQLDKTLNFIFTADTLSPQTICVSNTSDTSLVYLEETNYFVNWGDGSISENVTVFFPESICHFYNYVGDSQSFEISLTGQNKLGVFIVNKTVTIPYELGTYDNPYGTVSFTSNLGSWVNTPDSQKYINFYDSDNTVSGQVSSNFVDIPYIVSGYTKSKINDLKGFGINPFVIGKVVTLSNGETGQVTFLGDSYTAYTISNLEYFDFPNNISVFVASSSGLTDVMLTQSAITKFEYLINVIEEPIIQTNVFIERGKNTGLESFRRIGEISNIVELQDYGYKFFELRNYNDL